jgi:hypothetical protein
MDAGKIKLSPEDVQAVGEVVYKANAAQGDHYSEYYIKSFAEADCECVYLLKMWL